MRAERVAGRRVARRAQRQGCSNSNTAKAQKLRGEARARAVSAVAMRGREPLIRVGMTVQDDDGQVEDPRAFRRALSKTEGYKRNPSSKHVGKEDMEAHGIGAISTGGIVESIKAEGYEYTLGDVTLRLAQAYGFCWGVERAVQMAYEARSQYPNERLFITNEIIHNPIVNERLREMGVHFIEDTDDSKDFSPVQEGDVVILPAFGATVDQMKLLADRGVNIVDTTCPWVSKVWNAVDSHKKKEYTSIIHGKWAHEETRATASFAGKYLIVKDMDEADYVAEYILGRGSSREEFMKKFENAMSSNFDPDEDLEHVGIANQTTMLKGETEQIGKVFQRAMMEKYGVENVDSHFMVLDTICDATQERQDAMYDLVDSEPEMMIVVGGFNSSNTSHLQEISEQRNIPSFWVDSHERIDSQNNCLMHRLSYGELVETEGFMPGRPVRIGVTSGASTPDAVIDSVLEKVLEAQKKARADSASQQPVAA